MTQKPLIIVDDNIPFIKGRLEPHARIVYADQFGFTPELVRDADAMIIRTRTRCNKALLKDSNVRIIATATIGMDQFDLPWCASAGIETHNAPGCNAPGVAQYVWSSILRLVHDVKGLKVGIVGCGNVGSIVEKWGKALGAEILVCDPPLKDAGLRPDSLPLEKLLREADVVTLHTPLTGSGDYPTYHLIGENEIETMRPGSILINAARGSVIDQIPLIRRLERGDLTAVIDTWENEPEINNRLLELSEIATFHIAGYSLEGKQRATRMALEAIERYFGFETDKSGLEPKYEFPGKITADEILQSYNPYEDTAPLRENPKLFDRLRADYKFRAEPSKIHESH